MKSIRNLLKSIKILHFLCLSWSTSLVLTASLAVQEDGDSRKLLAEPGELMDPRTQPGELAELGDFMVI
jgi:hypothetical protein